MDYNKKKILLRSRISFLFIMLFSLIITISIIRIQFIQGKVWKELIKYQKLEYKPIRATRGNIYTFDGNLLCTSLPYYIAALDPCIVNDEYFSKNINHLSHLLSDFYKDRTLDHYKNFLTNARNSNNRYLVLNKTPFTYKDRVLMTNWPFFSKGRIGGGIIFNKIEKRYKPFGSLASRSIGYISSNGIGTGIEYSFNNFLKGVDGSALFQKIAGNKYKIVHNGAEVKAINGYDVYTTIDINLQDLAHDALNEVLLDNDADYGCVVLMKVDTGEIRAMVNLSKSENGKYIEKYNYAIGSQGCREPGSTFKVAAMIAVLEETQMPIDNIIDTGNGVYNIYDRKVKDLKRGGWGTLSIKEVIERSSNVGIAMLVQEVFGNNKERFVKYLDNFCLTRPLGFQIYGEAKPFIKTPKDPTWSGVTLPWMSIGYETELTPLHILTFYNAIANNGKMVKPLVVNRINEENKNIKSFKPFIINNKICSPQTLQKIKSMLEGVVENGTAKNIKNGYYKIAGKSGTAKRIVNGKYVDEWYTSFAGYFPANNPKYSCIVVVDNPKKFKQQGGDICAPVFRRLANNISAKDADMQEIFKIEKNYQSTAPLIKIAHMDDILNIYKKLNISYPMPLDYNWGRSYLTDSVINWAPYNILSDNQMPNLLGMTLKNALFLLETRGIIVHTEGIGKVFQQSIPPGQLISKGTYVKLKLK